MKKILVIDDELQTLYLLLDCLKNKGFYAIGAENGLSGVQQAKKHLPNLIICDILMPELDGYSVLKALRQDPVTSITPFIFLTGMVNKAEIRKGMELGADDYLTKPCTLKEILKAISVQLEKQATLQKWLTMQSQTASDPCLEKFAPRQENPVCKNGATFRLPTDIKKSTVTQSIFPFHPKLTEVFNFIEANYHRPITLSEIAEAVGYSPTYLTNLMGQETGNTLHSWIIKRRMVAACSLLLETNLSVNQISEAVGYQDASYFSRQFHQLNGMPPKAWRKKSGSPVLTDGGSPPDSRTSQVSKVSINH